MRQSWDECINLGLTFDRLWSYTTVVWIACFTYITRSILAQGNKVRCSLRFVLGVHNSVHGSGALGSTAGLLGCRLDLPLATGSTGGAIDRFDRCTQAAQWTKHSCG